jgi:NAD(P)-dependent dehydrogenase (short-subunit alcohol dehydrogenase family)
VTDRFADQVVLVTGAGGAIGRAHAILLGCEGAKVVVNDYGGDTRGRGHSTALAEGVVDEIRASGGIAVADTHDVALEGSAIVATALEAFGGLHAVVNNAGVANGGQIDEIPVPEFDRMLAIHLGGSIAICRAAWPIMREQGYGRIVNTSSCAFFGLPQSSAYITAKAAVMGLTRALAQDGRGYDVKVNAIMPTAYSRLTAQSPEFGPVMEAGFPPESISPFAVALLTREVPCTGETFVVGGGRAARVVLATVPGLIQFHSIDGCLEQFDQVMDTKDIYIPPDGLHEILYECDRIGLDLHGLS